ncbi:Guanine nucleotide-binding protein G(i) subunit alpha-2 [Balamuthia mandrillaris]
MQIIHKNGFSEEELLLQKPVIFSNIIDSTQKLIRGVERFEDTKLDSSLEEAAENVLAIDLAENIDLTPELVRDIKALWDDPAIQHAFDNSSAFQLNDSTEYFYQELDRIAQPGYIPNEMDMLRVRKKTTGVIEAKFESGGINFRMVDVGGQRNERRKWIHCFEDVTAIIFVTSLSEYDLELEESHGVNRMVESLNLFADVINNQWFHDTTIILFLNKKDLFEKKITKVNLNVCFPSYNGPMEYHKAAKFIEKQFLKKNKASDTRFVYTHLTCATDTENVRVVFNAVEDVFLQKLLGTVF